ncbi:sugar ABC transporter permease [Aerococcus urinaeequi]|jgi:arabinogalactan oligomer/maltooligosaccharide transport system permease protein|uniref:Maltodextrin transport system permease protein MalD n=3 Tax=Aerococcus TaxID=1375 RepID=A0A2J9PMJ4_9LACT|nr:MULTISPECIES: sugar ABC transporter permease [Lactobacillales]ALZ87075.1 sugar ABC transporter permease [Aerococcus urinaeequi]AMB97435.1 sugar ABC transporter permease [Aerococcus urinaeequi]AMC01814.1 sugar ABC transporter permease [Aerococcus viridans]EFG49148.1 ABC transporter, permease protein [Aerococcus viridans ATCC 11563 = CCUG 4311]KAF3305523.1 ABC transporter permease subunit [Carnobacterium sp. PL17GRE32]
MAEKKLANTQKRGRFWTQFFTYAFLVFMAIIIIYPLLITITSAFRGGNLIAFNLNFSGQFTLSNFERLFTETQYGQWYINTLIVAVITMALQVTIITLAGYAYSRYRFAGRKQSLKFFIIVQMVPTTAALTAFYVMALLVGGLDKLWFLIFAYVGGSIPMNSWLMKGYFDTVPIDLDESAKLDGAGHLRTFGQIVLPLVRPMISVQALWAFMTPFGEYMLARFILRSPENYTVAIGLQQFITNPREQRVTLFAAGALLIALPISIMFFYLQKNFVSGLTAGGTKG